MILLLLLGGYAEAHCITGVVTRVIDGDTVVIGETKVRLAEIDAPERGQPFGSEARESLESLVLRKTVIVNYTQRDRYKRIIGTIILLSENALEINRILVKQGAAWHYKKYSEREDLARLQKEAKEQGRGLWALEENMPPWEFRSKK